MACDLRIFPITRNHSFVRAMAQRARAIECEEHRIRFIEQCANNRLRSLSSFPEHLAMQEAKSLADALLSQCELDQNWRLVK